MYNNKFFYLSINNLSTNNHDPLFILSGAIKKFVNEKAKISDIKVKSDAFQFVFLQVHPNNGEKSEDNVLWICHFCKRNLNISQRLDNKSSRAIVCECCLRWYHCECISLEEPIDETITYFCNLCKKNDSVIFCL